MIYNVYTLQSTPLTFVTESSLKPAFSKALFEAMLLCLTSPLMFLACNFFSTISISVAMPLPLCLASTLKSISPWSTRICPTGSLPSKNTSIKVPEFRRLVNHFKWFSQMIGSVLWAFLRTSGSLAQSKYNFASDGSAKRYVITAKWLKSRVVFFFCNLCPIGGQFRSSIAENIHSPLTLIARNLLGFPTHFNGLGSLVGHVRKLHSFLSSCLRSFRFRSIKRIYENTIL